MISPHEIPIGKTFWIRADIDGGGEIWQRAMIRETKDAIVIRYLDSEDGFEDNWDDDYAEPRNMSLTDPEASESIEVTRLKHENSMLRRRVDELDREIKRLRDGITECLMKNRHLADGDDCTLIGLKRLLLPNAAGEPTAPAVPK